MLLSVFLPWIFPHLPDAFSSTRCRPWLPHLAPALAFSYLLTSCALASGKQLELFSPPRPQPPGLTVACACGDLSSNPMSYPQSGIWLSVIHEPLLSVACSCFQVTLQKRGISFSCPLKGKYFSHETSLSSGWLLSANGFLPAHEKVSIFLETSLFPHGIDKRRISRFQGVSCTLPAPVLLS